MRPSSGAVTTSDRRSTGPPASARSAGSRRCSCPRRSRSSCATTCLPARSSETSGTATCAAWRGVRTCTRCRDRSTTRPAADRKRRPGRPPSCRRGCRYRWPARVRSWAGPTSCSGWSTSGVRRRQRRRERSSSAASPVSASRGWLPSSPRTLTLLARSCSTAVATRTWPPPSTRSSRRSARSSRRWGPTAWRRCVASTSSRGCCPSSRRCCRPVARRSGPTPTPSGWPCSTRSPACCGPHRWRRRSCWSSTTCTGPARPRCRCSATCCARPVGRGSSSSAPTGTPSWPGPTRWPRRSPTCAGTALPPGSRSAGWRRLMSTRTSRPSGSTTGPSAASSPRSRRGTRTSSSRWCGTSRRQVAPGRPVTSPRACARRPAVGCPAWATSTNRALSVAAVVGTTFDLTLVEQVDGNDLARRDRRGLPRRPRGRGAGRRPGGSGSPTPSSGRCCWRSS